VLSLKTSFLPYLTGLLVLAPLGAVSLIVIATGFLSYFLAVFLFFSSANAFIGAYLRIATDRYTHHDPSSLNLSCAPFYYSTHEHVVTITSPIIFTLLSSAFGALHCISWSFLFASATHRTLWRVCSLIITFAPALPVLMMVVTVNLPPARRLAIWLAKWIETALERDGRLIYSSVVARPREEDQSATAGSPIATDRVLFSHVLRAVVSATMFGVMFLYLPARLVLVVIAFISLSNMPATAHQSLEWSNFIPHL
jgi:hypothetical protein